MKSISILLFIFLFLINLSSISQTLILKSAHMLDVKKGVIISPAVIIIKGGFIDDINPKQIPVDAEVIDLGSKTL